MFLASRGARTSTLLPRRRAARGLGHTKSTSGQPNRDLKPWAKWVQIGTSSYKLLPVRTNSHKQGADRKRRFSGWMPLCGQGELRLGAGVYGRMPCGDVSLWTIVGVIVSQSWR